MKFLKKIKSAIFFYNFYLQKNRSITDLNISKNCLKEKGCEIINPALGNFI